MDLSRLAGLDLFSGIGGIGQALSPWVRTVAYCERERYPQAVLLSRMERGEIDRAPIWDDVLTLRGDMLPRVDIIFGGFPCQDISTAGAGAGLGEGTRSGLYTEIIRLAGELRPSYIFLENVSAITVRGGERVIGDLTAAGYDCSWLTLSASDCGATHGRERWWCLAYPKGARERGELGNFCEAERGQERGLFQRAISPGPSPLADARHRKRGHTEGPERTKGKWQPQDVETKRPSETGMGHSERQRLQGSPRTGLCGPEITTEGCQRFPSPPRPKDFAGWEAYLESYPTLEPAICGSPSWLQSRRDRVKSLGNSVDWFTARQAFQILSGLTAPTPAQDGGDKGEK